MDHDGTFVEATEVAEEQSKFDTLVAWVRSQHSAVEQVKVDQITAVELVDAAEAELAELRRGLEGLPVAR